MKKLLVIIFLVLAFFTIDHPIVKGPRDKLFNQTMSDLSAASKVNKEVKAKRALEQIRQQVRLTEKQDQHLASALNTVNGMYAWERKYCLNRELNEYLFGDALRQSCSVIAITH